MVKLRFLHLSDIHFGQEKSGELVFYEDIRARLVDDVAEQAGALGPAMRILVTGDSAYSGKKTEFEKAAQWLDLVASKAGCARTAVSTIPGNHDVDVAAIDKWVQLGHTGLRSAEPETVLASLNELTAGENDQDPLVDKLAAYRAFASQYESDFNSSRLPSWQRVFEFEPPFKLRLVGLNTVLVSQKGDTPGVLVLGPQCVLDPQDDVETLVLMHHPLRWFKDEHNAAKYLKQRARVMITGHEHLPQWEVVKDERENEHFTMRAGATTPPANEASKGIGFCYNWIEVHQETGTGGRVLCVRVFPRIWNADKVQFGEDYQRTQGKGCLSFMLGARMLKSMPTQAPTQTVSQPETPPKEESLVHTSADGSEPQPVKPDDERFARLRMFFWRHLTWQQRLKVLSNLELLPTTLNRAIPQTVERLALDAARERRVLFDLWTAIMEYVPSELRESNPFRRGE